MANVIGSVNGARSRMMCNLSKFNAISRSGVVTHIARGYAAYRPLTTRIGRNRLITLFAALVYLFAVLNSLQYYVLDVPIYLKMDRYLRGTERLPFQERILAVPILHAIDAVAAHHRILISGRGVFTANHFAFFALALVSFLIANVFAVMLYRAVAPNGTLTMLVPPILLALTLSTYVIRTSAHFAYPYDMPSLAFFSAGLYFIYKRYYIPLVFVILIGTFNRETTLFLIVIYVLDAIAPAETTSKLLLSREFPFWRSFRWHGLPWMRATILAMIWLAIRLSLRHHFAMNDHSEEYNRVAENWLKLTNVKYLPTILGICGYSVPIVFPLRRYLPSRRLAAWMLVIVVWLPVMFVTGVITETRIYGELIPLMAVAIPLLIEERIAQVVQRRIISRETIPRVTAMQPTIHPESPMTTNIPQQNPSQNVLRTLYGSLSGPTSRGSDGMWLKDQPARHACPSQGKPSLCRSTVSPLVLGDVSVT